MGSVAVIGDEPLVRGFALAGALVFAAGDAGEVLDAWRALPDDVALVILTEAAAAALDPQERTGELPLVTVMA
jgi:vacuolar-type H+-ATPase subunit F/Vma7